MGKPHKDILACMFYSLQVSYMHPMAAYRSTAIPYRCITRSSFALSRVASSLALASIAFCASCVLRKRSKILATLRSLAPSVSSLDPVLHCRAIGCRPSLSYLPIWFVCCPKHSIHLLVDRWSLVVIFCIIHGKSFPFLQQLLQLI